MLTDECSLLYRRGLTGTTTPCNAQPQECSGVCCGKRYTYNCPPRMPQDASAQSTPRQSTDPGKPSISQPPDPGTTGSISRGGSSLKEAPQDRTAILSEMERVMKSICNCQNDLPERLKITSLPPDCKPLQYIKESPGTYTISQTAQEPAPVLSPSSPDSDQPTCTSTSCKIAKEISEIEENLQLLRRELLRTRKEQEWLREQKRLLDCVKPKPRIPCPTKPQICVPSKYPSPQIVACVNTIKPTWTLPKCDGKKP